MKKIFNFKTSQTMKGLYYESKTRIIYSACRYWRIGYLFLISVIFLALVGCSDKEEGTGIKGNFNLEGQPITVTVIVHDSEKAIRDAYNQAYGGEDLVEQGFAVATYDPIGGHHCEIHVTAIRSVTDNTRINTWGHEYMHCVYGLWHD